MSSLWRRLALFNQGLAINHSFGKGLEATQCAIEHLGYVQIDTISVVERAHHHVLWNRIPDYDNNHLNQLVKRKSIFEYWYHAASYLPMRDYRFVLPQMASVRNGESRYFGRGDPHLMNEILARVRVEGELKLRHIDKNTKGENAGWWNSGPARRSVEQLFMQGDLMICSRNGMEKVFDLTERCLPPDLNLSMPSIDEYALYLFQTTLRSHGVFTWKQLLHLKVGEPIRNAMRKVIDEQLENGKIIEFKSPEGYPFYIHPQSLETLAQLKFGVKILSPFDNLIIHRERLSQLFNFEYKIECYVPAQKRLFGYFCLPVLYGDQLVARIDCKAHRRDKKLEVLSLHIEDKHKIEDKEHFISALNQELIRFCYFNQCTTLDQHVIDQCL